MAFNLDGNNRNDERVGYFPYTTVLIAVETNV
jgi:hypothetical protein